MNKPVDRRKNLTTLAAKYKADDGLRVDRALGIWNLQTTKGFAFGRERHPRRLCSVRWTRPRAARPGGIGARHPFAVHR